MRQCEVNNTELKPQLIHNFVAHFFGTKDEAIAEYVKGLLQGVAGAARGEESTADVEDICSSLQGFLDVSAPAAELQPALAQLLTALRAPSPSALQQVPVWAAPPPPELQPNSTHSSPSITLGAGGTQHNQKPCPTHTPLPAHPQSQAGARSSLSVHAAAFTPPPVSDTPAGSSCKDPDPELLSHALGGLGFSECTAGGSVAGDPAGAAWEGPVCVPSAAWNPARGGMTQQAQHQEEGWWVAGQGEGEGGGAEGGWGDEWVQGWGVEECGVEDESAWVGQGPSGAEYSSACLWVLSQQFPEYSAEALREVLQQQGGRLEAAAAVLCDWESELSGQRALGGDGGAAGGAGRGGGDWGNDAVACFGDQDFPSLGGPSPSRQGATAPATAAAVRPSSWDAAGRDATYAARAAAGAAAAVAVGTPRTQWDRRGGGEAGPPSGRPPSGNPLPIWASGGEVERFATGARAAAEYSDARQEARDHARLRNMYFQQATLAYMGGQRALARELGQKGRWHAEHMHAAHSAAADTIFSRRNRGGAAAAGGGGSGGVPTIDLHGLHLSEAVGKLRQVLAGVAPRGGPPHARGTAPLLRVVVGAGQHGKVPARLPRGVRNFLEGEGLRVREPYVGLLEVHPPT